MFRFRKAFMWLLTIYIITVIIMVIKLRENNQRHSNSVQLDSVGLVKDIVKRSRAEDKNSERSGATTRTVDVPDIPQVNDEGLEMTKLFAPAYQSENEEVKETSGVNTYIRFGPGENGTGVKVTDRGKVFMATAEYQRKWNLHGFNTYVSDIVSLQRKVPDFRPEACKAIKYPIDMAPASVVIIFRDELPSVLLRTAYSVLGASPANLLKEVVLVDDGSEDLELKIQVDIHVMNVDKFKLVRNRVPLGLMLARQKGIEATTSEYFVVMDGHMEVGPGWLEPLIARLHEVPKALVCSHVGGLDHFTFQYYANEKFDAEFPFFDTLTLSQMWAKYTPKFKQERNGSVSAMPIGTIQGMVAAMKKDFFLQLGGFDPGMKQWGAEQMELSIKVWLCGGQVEMLPCSKVAHMYRVTPWGRVNKTFDFVVGNTLRTSEVWLDDPIKSIIRESISKHSDFEIGNLTDRHRIRKENNCKPFQYFVDMVKTFSDVYLIDNIKAKGYIRNKASYSCLCAVKQKDSTYNLSIGSCSTTSKYYFILTEHNQIRSIQGTVVRAIVDIKNNTTAAIEVERSVEYSYMEDAVWEYRNDGSLYNVASKYCLTVVGAKLLVAEKCNNDLNQQWDWQRV